MIGLCICYNDEEPVLGHLLWYQRWQAVPGDRITIEILETSFAPEPTERSEAQSKSPSVDERVFYERTKEIYFALKDKYEPEP